MSAVQIKFAGTFSNPDEPQLSSSGLLTVHSDGSKAELATDSHIMTERSVSMDIAHAHETHMMLGGSPADNISDFSPRTFFGTTEEGVELTALDARISSSRVFSMSFSEGGGQRFNCRTIIVGSHFMPDQKITNCRYTFAGSWASHLNDKEASVPLFGGCTLKFTNAESSFVMDIECTSGALLREYESHILFSYMSLLKTATQQRLRVISMQIKSEGETKWSDVYLSRVDRVRANPTRRPWIMRDEAVTADHIAKWISNSYKADSLVEGLAGLDEEAPIESQVISLTAIAEGLHRKLFDHRVGFAGMTGDQLTEVRTAASSAGTTKFTELGGIDAERMAKKIGDSLNGLNDLSYRERMIELEQTASLLEPGSMITSDFANWSSAVAFVRNKLVHQLPYVKGKKDRPILGEKLREEKERLLDLQIATSYSLSWILRLTLLSLAGFQQDDLSEAIAEFEDYQYACANIESLMAGHPKSRDAQKKSE
ncbi:ApeA N-terminal domain 1-containing protein [Nocardia sp. NPDC055321]